MEWPPVRRFSHLERRNKIGVIKGFTKQRHEKRLPASKHVILEDDVLTENIGKDQSGKEIADMLCNMPQKLVQRVCCSSLCRTFRLQLLLRLFQFQQVPVGSVSRHRSGNQAKKTHCFKVSVFGSHVGPGSAKSDSFLCSFFGSSAHIQFFRCCGRYRYCAVSWLD